MGIGMQKQAVSLLTAESAIVMSGIFNQFIANGSFSTLAAKSGVLTFFTDKKIYLKSSVYLGRFSLKNRSFWNKLFLNINLKNLSKKPVTNIVSLSNLLNLTNFLFNYNLKKMDYRINNRDILNGDNKKNSSIFGVGKNLFLAYMSWRGYNFEDAIVINERLITNNLFTSIQTRKYIVFLLKGVLGRVWN
jgi:DNA-directed RNA polymerase subunit beta